MKTLLTTILLTGVAFHSVAQRQEFEMLVPFQCEDCDQADYYTTTWEDIMLSGICSCFDPTENGWMIHTTQWDSPIDQMQVVRVFNLKPYGFTMVMEVGPSQHIQSLTAFSADGSMVAKLSPMGKDLSLFRVGNGYFFWLENDHAQQLTLLPLYPSMELLDEYRIGAKYNPPETDYHIILDTVRYKDGIMFFDAHYLYPDGSTGPVIESVDLFHGEPRTYNPWEGYH